MIELIRKALDKGGALYASVSGGKDGDAMVETLIKNSFPITGLIHADLGRVEWPESLQQCNTCSGLFSLPLHVVRRSDGLGLLEYWKRRLIKLKGTGKPFWSSAKNRYCTSDLKRGPINKFFTQTGHTLIIDCQGIRAAESYKRAKKNPLSINISKSSTFYKGMTAEEAINAFNPKYKLVIVWYPIFNFTIEEVWNTKGQSVQTLTVARKLYKESKTVPAWWPFNPVYAYGNDRVSCKFCILGSLNDLINAAEHDPELLEVMIAMQYEGGATFKDGWSLKQLL